MDCLNFSKWLEERDLYDVSEADKALKHTLQCYECKRKLRLDEQLEQVVFDAMKPVAMPDSLQSKIDMNLERVSQDSAKRSYGWYGIVPVAIAAMIVFFVAFPFSSGISSMDEMGKYVIGDHNAHDDSVLVIDKPESLNQLEDGSIEYASVKSELPQDYQFVGARICPLGDCRAIHIVYQDNGKRYSLYIIKAVDVDLKLSSGRQYTMTMGEQVVKFWKKDGNIFAMTS